MEEFEADTSTRRSCGGEDDRSPESNDVPVETLPAGGPERIRKRWPISDSVWNAHKHEIYELYIRQSLTLAKTMDIMSERGFTASKKLYKNRLKTWGYTKYHTKDTGRRFLQDNVRRPYERLHATATDDNGICDWEAESCTGSECRHTGLFPGAGDGDASPLRETSLNFAIQDDALSLHTVEHPRRSLNTLLFPSDGKDTNKKKLVDLKNKGTQLLRRDFPKEAKYLLKNALNGFKRLHLDITENPCVVEAAWGLIDAYTVNSPEAKEQLESLSVIYCTDSNLWNDMSVLHYTRIIEALQLYGRQQDATVLGLRLYLAAREQAHPQNSISLSGSEPYAPEQDEPDSLGKYLLDTVFPETFDKVNMDQKLRLARLWCTAGLPGMDYVVKNLAQLWCFSDRAPDIRYLSLRLRIARNENYEVRTDCKTERDSMAKRILNPHMTQQEGLLRQCRELAKLHLLNGDLKGYYVTVNWTADNLEKAVLRSNMKDKTEAIQLLIDHLAQTGIDCYKHPRWGWSKARLWFERAYVMAITKLGAHDERSLYLERELALECYMKERFLI